MDQHDRDSVIRGEDLRFNRDRMFQGFRNNSHKKWTLVCNCVSYSKKNAAHGGNSR